MNKMAAMAGLVLALSTAPAAAQDRTAAYTACLTANIVELGRGNSESAETLLKVARPKCSNEYRLLVLQAEGDALVGRLTGGAPENADELLAKKVERAEGEAIEALLKARASKAERG